MKIKISIFSIALSGLLSLPHLANAYMTKDLILIKAGWIPTSAAPLDKDKVTAPPPFAYITDDLESNGFAAQLEYNLVWDVFWLGLGVEYQNMTVGKAATTLLVDSNKFKNHFIIPMISAKLASTGGIYLGAGVSGKYLISTKKFNLSSTTITTENEFNKNIDLWTNGILGYHLSVGEGFFLTVEGRFGYNVTNNQFEKLDQTYISASNEIIYSPKQAYDIAFYFGIGTRARASMY